MSRTKLIEKLIFELDNLRKILTPNLKTIPSEGPSPAQFRLISLILLSGPEQEFSVKEIAKILSISSSASTQLIDGLVSQQLLERIENPTDRRKIIVKLSPKSKDNFNFLKNTMLGIFQNQVKHLSDIELTTLLDLITKISHQ